MRTYQPPDYHAFRQRVARRRQLDRLLLQLDRLLLFLFAIALWTALTVGGVVVLWPAATRCAASATTTEARP